jgi:hypothetical protein
MPNICKPKGAKDDKQNVEFVRYAHNLHVSIQSGAGYLSTSKNIPKSEFESKYEVVSEDATQPKE